MLDWEFNLFSYNTSRFGKNGVVLRDGYEHASDGHAVSEIENYYTINSTEFQKILSLIADEYKNESILSEYNGANAYYENLSKREDKFPFIFFYIILNQNRG
ncbi:MAG: hypothetical protein LBG43_00015 [Treponema sp.]|jgi:hypothetical protein|nr:hypothetical protein [Treponema sp.]